VISILVVGAIVAFFLVKKRSKKKSFGDVEKLDNQPLAPLTSNEVHGQNPAYCREIFFSIFYENVSLVLGQLYMGFHRISQCY
jgi:hypothetical protein